MDQQSNTFGGNARATAGFTQASRLAPHLVPKHALLPAQPLPKFIEAYRHHPIPYYFDSDPKVNGDQVIRKQAIVCANPQCGRKGHTIASCRGPVDRYGRIPGCPRCNNCTHILQFCGSYTASKDAWANFIHYLFTKRDGLPPLITTFDIRDIPGFGDFAGRPWTAGFAKANWEIYQDWNYAKGLARLVEIRSVIQDPFWTCNGRLPYEMPLPHGHQTYVEWATSEHGRFWNAPLPSVDTREPEGSSSRYEDGKVSSSEGPGEDAPKGVISSSESDYGRKTSRKRVSSRRRGHRSDTEEPRPFKRRKVEAEEEEENIYIISRTVIPKNGKRVSDERPRGKRARSSSRKYAYSSSEDDAPVRKKRGYKPSRKYKYSGSDDSPVPKNKRSKDLSGTGVIDSGDDTPVPKNQKSTFVSAQGQVETSDDESGYSDQPSKNPVLESGIIWSDDEAEANRRNNQNKELFLEVQLDEEMVDAVEESSNSNTYDVPSRPVPRLTCVNCGGQHATEACDRGVCGKCGDADHRNSHQRPCRYAACRCTEFPQHTSKECEEMCSGIQCTRTGGRHIAMACTYQCCMCGEFGHAGLNCICKSCPCGKGFHLGQLHRDQQCPGQTCGMFFCRKHCNNCGYSRYRAEPCPFQRKEVDNRGQATIRCQNPKHGKFRTGHSGGCPQCRHSKQDEEKEKDRKARESAKADADGWEKVEKKKGKGDRRDR